MAGKVENMDECDLECGDRFFRGRATCRHSRTVMASLQSLTFGGIPVRVDSTMPRDEIRLENPNGESVTITNIKAESPHGR